MCFALVPKLVPRTVDFHWYWYRILKFWYRDNTSNDSITTKVLKEYLPEKLFTRIYLAEKFKYITQYFWKNN